MDRLPFSRRQLLLLVLAAGVVLLVAGRYLASAGAPTADPPLARRPAAAFRPTVQRVVVDVVGAVRRPGLYRLPQGGRIADAVDRAGGPLRSADLASVNLAAPLADGEQVVVPQKLPAAAGSAGGASAAASPDGAPAGPVHLSTATVDELDALPGVGPVTAQKIVDYRTAHGAFSSVDELDAVPGIGPAKLDELRDLVAP